MKALVIYDTYYSNTERIAWTIGKYLGEDVQVIKVGELLPEQLQGVELLIVGSPTRYFRPTKAITKFLKELPDNSLAGVKVAAFDTRLNTYDTNAISFKILVKYFDYAAKYIANLLVKKGGQLVLDPEGFYVFGNAGPLKNKELERSIHWIKKIK